MAKASESDLNAALEMCRALDALEDGSLPDEMTEGEDVVFYDAKEHAEKVVEHLISIQKRASLFRVCFGMTVVLDPKNEMVDPSLDHIEFHPKIVRITEQRDELLKVLKDDACRLLRASGYAMEGTATKRILDAITKAEAV
jgi:hypothetical protein